MKGRCLPNTGPNAGPSAGKHWLWAAMGLMLVAAQVLLIVSTRGLIHHNAATYAAVLPLILAIAIPAALLLLAGPRLLAAPPTPFIWATLIVVGVLMRAVWFGQTPPLDDDYFRYLWDGAVVASALDPYRHAPSEFVGSGGADAYRRLASGVQTILENVNFNEMRTIYPSVAQAGFALAALIAPFKVDGLRVVFLGGELATLFLLIEILRSTGRSPLWAAMYWWNPLAVVMTVGLVHVDALISPLVLGALLMHARGRSIAAVTLLGLGAGVKIWPLLLAPIVLWPLVRRPWRLVGTGLVLAATLLVTVGPVLWSTLRPGSGLTAYATGWTNNNAFYAWTLLGLNNLLGQPDGLERSMRVTLALVTGGVALAQAFRGNATLDSILSRGLIVAAATFYLSPAQFPWYAIWFLPLAALRGNWALLLASAVLPFYYLFFPLWPLENGALFFYGMAFIHSVPVLGWLLFDAIAERNRARHLPTEQAHRASGAQ